MANAKGFNSKFSKAKFGRPTAPRALLVQSGDTLILAISDSSYIQVTQSAGDSLGIAILENATITVFKYSGDSLVVAVSDVSDIVVTPHIVYTGDTIVVAVSDVSDIVTGLKYSNDSLGLQISESSLIYPSPAANEFGFNSRFSIVSFGGIPNMDPAPPLPYSPILAGFNALFSKTPFGKSSYTGIEPILVQSSDSLVIQFDEAGVQVSITVRGHDQLILGPTFSGNIDVRAFGYLSVGLVLRETSTVHNVDNIMNADTRKIYAKVEVTYSDPFLDESIDVVASETGRLIDESEVADGITETKYKWFSLHNNKLDGTFHPRPANRKYKVGWWGNTLSDENGQFVSDPVLSVTLESRPFFLINVVGDDKLEEFPVDFTVRLYSGESMEVEEVVTDNDDIYWSKEVEAFEITRVELTIHKINKPYVVAKITELYAAVTETYYDDDLIYVNLLEELEFEGATIPLGNVSANEVAVGFKNDTDHFNPKNPHSPIAPYIKKNRKIKAWFGVELSETLFLWYPLGVFWSRNWNIPFKGLQAETSGWDRLEFLRRTEFSTSQVYESISLYDIAELVLQNAGLIEDEYIIDDALSAIIVGYAWFNRMSHREALRIIARAALGNVYCDRLGRIVISTLTIPDSYAHRYTFDNIVDRQQKAALDIANYIEVKVKPRVPGTLETIYEDVEEITVPAEGTVEVYHYYNFVPVIDAQEPDITAGADISVLSWESYCWGMKVVYQNTGLVDQAITEVTIDGRKLDVAGGKIVVAQDTASIKENGKQSLVEPVDIDFIQTTSRGNTVASSILALYSDPDRLVTLPRNRGHIALVLGDKVSAPEYGDLTSDFVVMRQLLDWKGYLEADTDLQKI